MLQLHTSGVSPPLITIYQGMILYTSSHAGETCVKLLVHFFFFTFIFLLIINTCCCLKEWFSDWHYCILLRIFVLQVWECHLDWQGQVTQANGDRNWSFGCRRSLLLIGGPAVPWAAMEPSLWEIIGFMQRKTCEVYYLHNQFLEGKVVIVSHSSHRCHRWLIVTKKVLKSSVLEIVLKSYVKFLFFMLNRVRNCKNI